MSPALDAGNNERQILRPGRGMLPGGACVFLFRMLHPAARGHPRRRTDVLPQTFGLATSPMRIGFYSNEKLKNLCVRSVFYSNDPVS